MLLRLAVCLRDLLAQKNKAAPMGTGAASSGACYINRKQDYQSPPRDANIIFLSMNYEALLQNVTRRHNMSQCVTPEWRDFP
jgi:hypothetical protein